MNSSQSDSIMGLSAKTSIWESRNSQPVKLANLDIGAAQGARFDCADPRSHGFDPEGRLLVMRPPGPSQIYSMDFEVP